MPRVSQQTIRRLQEEGAIPFSEARQCFPASCRPDLSTLHRWATKGSRGVRLESFRVGRLWATSKPAVDRFVFARTNATP